MKFTFLFTGRLTHDATIKNISGDRNVLNFTVAVNDYYKKKGDDSYTNDVSYVECSYWRNPSESQLPRLTKGSLIQVDGFIKAEAYNAEGRDEPVAKLVCKVEDYVVLVTGSQSEASYSPGIDEVPESYYEDLEKAISKT